MSKYIIKNCPACRPYDVFGRDNEGCCYLEMKYCKDVDNCITKHIVEKCKKAEKAYFTSGNTDMFISGRSNLAGNILAMLEIQECENGN